MNLRVLVAAAAAALVLAAPVLSARPTATQHDRDVIRFFTRHPRLGHTAAGERALWRVLGDLADQLRSVQSARAARLAEPAHLALWRCLERGESGGDGVHPGHTDASNGTHYNVLQMTDPWAGFDPIGKTYEAVEAEAESQYQAALRGGTAHARDWLSGQWGQTIGPCWGYAG